jgi:sulfide:quinone oxidoreductase
MKAVMDIRKINRGLSVSPQIAPADMAELKMAGFRSIICNRPDGEGNDQPTFEEIEEGRPRRRSRGALLPIIPGRVGDEDAGRFDAAADLPGPGARLLPHRARARPRSGRWPKAPGHAVADILASTKAAGYDMAGVVRRIANGGKTPTDVAMLS